MTLALQRIRPRDQPEPHNTRTPTHTYTNTSQRHYTFTAGPKESCDIATRIQAAGAEYLEAPVLGSQPEASKGALLIMVGSENDPQDSRAWPVLASLGKEPMHMGAVGTAAATKLALNQLIASLTVSAAFPGQLSITLGFSLN